MVIDLTRRPVFLNTDICPSWLVVRTSANKEADGILRRKLEKRERPRRGEKKSGGMMAELTPGASLDAPNRKLLETRILIDGFINPRPEDAFPGPYEVATVCVNAFTHQMSVWRAQLHVEHTKNKQGGLWLITVRDEAAKIDLVTATVKELEESRVVITVGSPLPGPQDQFPLKQVAQMMGSDPAFTGTLSIWDRIRQGRRQLVPEDPTS